MVDILLIILVLASGFFIVQMLLRKSPNLASININNLPGIKAERQKQIILQGRLYRSTQTIFTKAKKTLEPLQDQLNLLFKNYYQRLRSFEHELKRKGEKQLHETVDKSQTLDGILIEAKQLINSEEYQKAEDKLIESLTIDEHNVEAYKLLVDLYRARKQYDEAKETLEYLLRLTHEADSSVYFSLADIAKERGNLKQAEDDYLRSISLSDDNYLYFLNLAEVYLELDDKEKALQTAQRAYILAPNNPKILDFLINLCIIIQDRALAIDYLEQLKTVNPENNKIIEFNEKIDSLA
jgi:tetratricopeptide (TPR) repeat protein